MTNGSRTVIGRETLIPVGAAAGICIALWAAASSLGAKVDYRLEKFDERMQRGEQSIAVILATMEGMATDVRDVKLKTNHTAVMQDQLVRLQAEVDRGRAEREAMRMEIERLKQERPR